MLKEVLHIGLTIRDINVSKKFYEEVLGLKFKGELFMEGEETDRLFARKNTKVKVAYFNGSENICCPPIELLEFIDYEIENEEASLFKKSISEVCFKVADIEKVYKHLLKNNVECLSEPQYFDFTKYGFGKSKALYFKDPDGIILELIEEIE